MNTHPAKEEDRPTPVEPPPLDGADPASEWLARMVGGGAFIHDAPEQVPAVWGRGDYVLWSEGEPFIITGPTGVGKTTLGAQVIFGRLGYRKTVLGYPVVMGDRRVLYLAMDRPAQIRRALARLMRTAPRDELDARLCVWPYPPPMDLARNPRLLFEMAERADADTVVIDSLKDAALKLSDEETGQGINRAMQLCVSNGVEVLAYHHQTKRGGGDSKPKTLADVYGSAWITAGCGSVVLLWGSAGDPIVELTHLKQPSSEIGPLKLIHDNIAGTTDVFEGADVMSLLLSGPVTAREVAEALFGETPSDAQVQKARRKLEQLVRDNRAVQITNAASGGTSKGGKGGATGARYAAISPEEAPPDTEESAHGSAHGSANAGGPGENGPRPTDRPTLNPVPAGKSANGSANASHALIGPRTPPPLEGGVVWADADRGAENGHRDVTEFEGWVLSNVTRTPRPVGDISTDVRAVIHGADANDVQDALTRLAVLGAVLRHDPTGPGPHTWSLSNTNTAA